MTQSVQKKKIKETIQKDLEDIGIWNNIETIENNLTKMKTRMPLPFLVTPLMFKLPSNYIPRIIFYRLY
jgi:hypothetical protein